MLSLIAGMAMAASVADWNKPYLMTEVEDSQINESSGLAASRHSVGVFYTHNDSGDSARFFRFNKKGAVTGIFTLAGARATDWEDMASATVRGTSYLYFGDVGDNARERDHVTIYRVEEPVGAGRELKQFDTFTITYPDQARDCEAVFVHFATGDIWLVSKAREGITVVYRVENPRRTGDYKAEKVATIPVNTGGLGGNLVTGADVSHDGHFVILRTYTGALIYTVRGPFSEWVEQEPVMHRTAPEKQGESICFSQNSSAWLTSSEGLPCPISISTRVR